MLQLSKDEQLALYKLSRYPEFWILKKILADWAHATDSVTDIVLSSDVPAQVAGKQQTLKAVNTLLADLDVIDKPREPKIDTHE
jgi:hypothetical protein